MLGISCYSSKIWARQILLKYSFSFNRQVILTADESKRPKQGIILRSSDSGRTFHSIRLPFQPSLPMIYHSSHSDHLLAYSTDVSKLRARCILKVCICLHHDWLCAFQDVQGWVVGTEEEGGWLVILKAALCCVGTFGIGSQFAISSSWRSMTFGFLKILVLRGKRSINSSMVVHGKL